MARKPKAEPKPRTNCPPWEAMNATYLVGRAHIDGVDSQAIDMERKWGAGRLRLLVDNDLRARFDSQRLKLRVAILTGELIDVQREAQRMANAWNALDIAATQAGAKVMHPLVWEVTSPATGKVYALVRTPAEAKHVAPEGRHTEVCTLDEIAHVLDHMRENYATVSAVKEVFPGAEVTRIKPICDPLQTWDENEGDPLPPTLNVA